MLRIRISESKWATIFHILNATINCDMNGSEIAPFFCREHIGKFSGFSLVDCSILATFIRELKHLIVIPHYNIFKSFKRYIDYINAIESLCNLLIEHSMNHIIWLMERFKNTSYHFSKIIRYLRTTGLSKINSLFSFRPYSLSYLLLCFSSAKAPSTGPPNHRKSSRRGRNGVVSWRTQPAVNHRKAQWRRRAKTVVRSLLA